MLLHKSLYVRCKLGCEDTPALVYTWVLVMEKALYICIQCGRKSVVCEACETRMCL